MIQQDRNLLKDQNTYHSKCAIQLRISEKQVIQDSISAINKNKKKKSKQVEKTEKSQ